ncbi:MAG: nucleotide exchange factor GrpE [Thermogutta sp.]|nr:nucleotide exchange factor GrpE [Thermogutta sp.]
MPASESETPSAESNMSASESKMPSSEGKMPPADSSKESPSPDQTPPDAAGSGGVDNQAQITRLQSEAEALRREADEHRNRAMRWQAEFENYQKRVQRQIADDRRYAGADLIRDLLPVLDNLRRAIESAEQNHDLSALLAGLNMIVKQWQDVLAKHECRRIEALNQPFDPNLHHAISRQPTADAPPNTVIYVTQEGYTLHDRVVRPSQVVVSMPLDGEGEQPEHT